jgi:hypothetical protein
MIRKLLLTLISLLVLLFIISQVTGYVVYPVGLDIKANEIEEITISTFEKGERKTLTNDQEVINAILNNLDGTWVSTFQNLPKGEKPLIVDFRGKDKQMASDLSILYYPQSSVIEFLTKEKYPNPILTFSSNKKLKQLVDSYIRNDAIN